eukprot:1181383-Prorocentrum_minimum.AAC.13
MSERRSHTAATERRRRSRRRAYYPAQRAESTQRGTEGAHCTARRGGGKQGRRGCNENMVVVETGCNDVIEMRRNAGGSCGL